MLKRVLIANRGEIAVRVARACRQLGVQSVAVFSEVDREALHVRCADESVCIGPPNAALSYLNPSAILAAAREMECDSIHPGYGFLSENADFAQQAMDAGLAWVGPPPHAIRAMGLKVESRDAARRSGVPVVPGFEPSPALDGNQALAALLEAASTVGFPLLVKATAGGGGKGMRLVTDGGMLEPAILAAMREAESAFGDGRVYLERYIERPRHIEIQLLGDMHGRVVHLGERECSIQRRHQKVIEECPAPLIESLGEAGTALRDRLGSYALAVARSVGYESAGTVEFIVSPTGEAFFLEMNTRLQVEHPVTELVYGVDIVEWQLRIAAGERLGFDQADLRPHGHAIEVRICAEDPSDGFMPQAGRLFMVEFPEGDGIRCDSGIDCLSTIPTEYDSMLAKLVAFGDSRAVAISRLKDSLSGTCILGPATNLRFLEAIVATEAFSLGELHTGFIAENLRAWKAGKAGFEALFAAAVAMEAGQHSPTRHQVQGAMSAWASLGGWSNSGRSVSKVELGGRYVDFRTKEGLERWWYKIDGERVLVAKGSQTHCLGPQSQTAQTAPQGTLTARMPGKLISLGPEPGVPFEAGTVLVVVEAMKMEHEVLAPTAGTVHAYPFAPGDRVMPGDLLVEMRGSS